VQRRTRHDASARSIARLALALVGLALAVGGAATVAQSQSPSAPATRAQLVERMPRALSLARMRADLRALERIADRNGGTRAAGTPGYTASVVYVRAQLRRAGYDVRLGAFPFVEFLEHLEKGRQLQPIERVLQLEALDYSPSTPRSGLRARVVPSGDGCTAADFGAVRGAIALVERGTCFFAVKAANAEQAGAVGVLVFNNEAGPLDGTLGDPQATSIPVAGIARSLGLELAGTENAIVEMELLTETRGATSLNVTADTQRRGGPVLLVGAHLDSVRAGAGINDNGTGVAAVLEIARVLRTQGRRLTVRVAFWGAEELGLFGSRAYARTVGPENVVGYLNLDVLGSPSRRYAVYGSGRLAARLLRYLERRGLPARTIDLQGRSDHAPFAQRGISVAGLFAGDYACYHRACDRVANVDLTALDQLAEAAAFGVASTAPLQR
jgi:Peptidase family M28/PA domain